MFRANSEDKPTEEFCHHGYVSNAAIHLVLYQFSPRQHLSRWSFFTEPEPLAQRRASFKERSSLSGSSSEGFFPGKNLLSNLFIFTLQSEQKLAAIHHARIAMALLGMKYQQNSASDIVPRVQHLQGIS